MRFWHLRAASLCASLLLFTACDSVLLLPGGDSGPPDSGAPIGQKDAGPIQDAEAAPDRASLDVESPGDAEPADSGTSDVGSADAGLLDSGSFDATPAGDAAVCTFGRFPTPDRLRPVLVGQPFGAVAGQHGTEIRAMALATDGTLSDLAVRLDVGQRPERIAFVPSGELALVLGDEGDLVSIRVNSPSDLTILDRVTVPGAGFKDLQILSDGVTVFVVNSDVNAAAGLSTVHLDCGGQLTLEPQAFHALRLSDSLAVLPGEDRAVLLGGQALFDPRDVNDVRLLSRQGGRFSEIAAFDLWTDYIDTSRIAVSPDGSTLLMPNGSPFSSEGGQVMVAEISGDVIREKARLTNMSDAQEALFSPDGATALITLFEPGEVVVLAERGGAWNEVSRLSGIGTPSQMALVSRGSLSGLVLIPSVDPTNDGSNITRVRFTGPGTASNLGQLNLPSGYIHIPGAIAVAP